MPGTGGVDVSCWEDASKSVEQGKQLEAKLILRKRHSTKFRQMVELQRGDAQSDRRSEASARGARQTEVKSRRARAVYCPRSNANGLGPLA